MMGYGAIALSVAGVFISLTEGWLYVAPTITLFVSGVVFLAFDAVVVKLEEIRRALTPAPENTITTRSEPSIIQENVVATNNGIKLRQDGGKLVARGITFDSIAEFESWARYQ
jgi:hypothetical protein